MEVSGQLHAPAGLSLGKEAQVPSKYVSRSLTRPELYAEEENLLLLPRIQVRFVGCPACNLVTILAILSRLRHQKLLGRTCCAHLPLKSFNSLRVDPDCNYKTLIVKL